MWNVFPTSVQTVSETLASVLAARSPALLPLSDESALLSRTQCLGTWPAALLRKHRLRSRCWRSLSAPSPSSRSWGETPGGCFYCTHRNNRTVRHACCVYDSLQSLYSWLYPQGWGNYGLTWAVASAWCSVCSATCTASSGYCDICGHCHSLLSQSWPEIETQPLTNREYKPWCNDSCWLMDIHLNHVFVGLWRVQYGCQLREAVLRLLTFCAHNVCRHLHRNAVHFVLDVFLWESG